MINFKLMFTVVALGVCLAVPATSSAYFTTAQNAVQLDSDTALYTITYKFGSLNSSLVMPALAERGLLFKGDSVNLGYTLKDGDSATEAGSSYGIVLSNAKLVNGEYLVPKGEEATFTLVVLAKLDKSISDKSDLSLQVTSLPFTMIKTVSGKESRQNLQLNPSELQYYVTPTISLK